MELRGFEVYSFISFKADNSVSYALSRQTDLRSSRKPFQLHYNYVMHCIQMCEVYTYRYRTNIYICLRNNVC